MRRRTRRSAVRTAPPGSSTKNSFRGVSPEISFVSYYPASLARMWLRVWAVMTGFATKSGVLRARLALFEKLRRARDKAKFKESAKLSAKHKPTNSIGPSRHILCSRGTFRYGAGVSGSGRFTSQGCSVNASFPTSRLRRGAVMLCLGRRKG
jgi:hypothetical protein